MIDIIESLVCTGEHISPDKLHIKSRITRYKETRQIIMSLAVSHKAATHEVAAGYFGLDHSTSVHAAKVVNNLCDTERKYAMKYAFYDSKVQEVKKVYEEINLFAALLKPINEEITSLETRLNNLKVVADDIKAKVDLLYNSAKNG